MIVSLVGIKIKLTQQYRDRSGKIINFQTIKTGDVLAHNEHGPVSSPMDGLILMPKYQPQGDDGFFIVQVVE